MSKKQTIIRIALVAGTAAVLALLIFFVVTSAKRPQQTPDEPLSDLAAAKSNETMNLLVVGADRTAGLHDVIMLLHVDLTVPRAVLLQLPRDTYAAYTDTSYRKLNGASHALGGEAALCEFLSASLGVTIDRYVSLDADALSDVVDAIGGVEITLPEALHYEDPAQALSIHLPAGTQTLDGKTAEYFVRYRIGYVRGDLGRMDAQKLFLAALAQKVKNTLTLPSALKLLGTVLPQTNTDLTLFEGARLLRAAFAMDGEQICMLTAPGEEAVATQSGASYYALSAPAMNEVLVRYFGAAEGKFDLEKKFCNPRYQSFCDIYNGYCPYAVYSLGEISEEGLEIEKRNR